MLSLLKKMWRSDPEQPPALPNVAADIPEYTVAFEAAAKFTRSCYPDAGDLTLRPGVSCSTRMSDAIAKVVASMQIAPSIKTNAAAQCLKWAHFMAPRLQEKLGMAAWPTIGQIWFVDKCVFDLTWDDLRTWHARGLHLSDLTARSRDGLNWHAWITLETGEIVDPTYLSSLAAIRPDAYGSWDGMVAGGRAEEAIGKHRFFPMAAGVAFCESMQAKSSIPFLASDANQLGSVAFVMY